MALKFSDQDSISALAELVRFLKKEQGIKGKEGLVDLTLATAREVGSLAARVKEKDKAKAKQQLADIMIQLIKVADNLGVDLFAITKERIEQKGQKVSLAKLKKVK